MEAKVIKNVEKRGGLSPEELRVLLKKWQKKLCLDDWDLDIEIVDFIRDDYRQSGGWEVDLKNKTGIIQMTCNPFRDEEYILVHEMIHVLIWDFDSYTEKVILKYHKPHDEVHGWYLENLERMVHKLAMIVLGREQRK